MRTFMKSIVLFILFISPAMAGEKRCSFTESMHSKMLFRGGGLYATTGSASSHVVNCSLGDGFYIGSFLLTPHQDFWTGAETDLWLGWSKSWGDFTLDLAIEGDYFSVNEEKFTMAALVPKISVSYKVASGSWGTWQVYGGFEAAEFIHGDYGYDRRLVGGTILSLSLNENMSWNSDLHVEFHDTTFNMQYGTDVWSLKTGPSWTFGDQSFGIDFLGVHGGFGPEEDKWSVSTSYSVKF